MQGLRGDSESRRQYATEERSALNIRVFVLTTDHAADFKAVSLTSCRRLQWTTERAGASSRTLRSVVFNGSDGQNSLVCVDFCRFTWICIQA